MKGVMGVGRGNQNDTAVSIVYSPTAHTGSINDALCGELAATQTGLVHIKTTPTFVSVSDTRFIHCLEL